MCLWISLFSYLVIEVDQSWKVDHHFYYSHVLFLCHPYLCGLNVMTTLKLIFLVAITFEWIFTLPLVFILTKHCSLNLEFLKKKYQSRIKYQNSLDRSNIDLNELSTEIFSSYYI